MPYLNSDVFYWAMPVDDCELVSLPPRAMTAAVERGELDAGPLPMADVLRLGDGLRPIGDFCVATKRESVSILLFSRRPPERLGGGRIAVTDHTSSSVQLLRILFAEWWRVAPGPYVGLDDCFDFAQDSPYDAVLLIGDQALQNRRGIEGFPYVYDLGSQWFDHTGGLPFVYARWVARADADPVALERFAELLRSSFERGIARIDEIATGRPELDMSVAEKVSYFKGFTYHLGTREYESIARFAKSLSNLPTWWPRAAQSASGVSIRTAGGEEEDA